MSRSLSQSLRVLPGVIPQDISAVRTGSYVDVSGAQRLLAAVTTGSIAATKKVTVQFLQATNSAGAGSKALGAAVEKVAPTFGAALDTVAEAKIEDLDEGFGFVAVRLSSDNGAAVYGSAMLILGGNRFNP